MLLVFIPIASQNSGEILATQGGLVVDTFNVEILKIVNHNDWRDVHINYNITGINKNKAIGKIYTFLLKKVVSSNVPKVDSCYIIEFKWSGLALSEKGIRKKKDWKPFSSSGEARFPLPKNKNSSDKKLNKILFICEGKEIIVDLPDAKNLK